MKRILLQTIFFYIFCFGDFCPDGNFNNQDVILMTQAGLSIELIIKKINDSKGHYEVSAQNLIDLKKAGVDDEVIKLLMEKAEMTANRTTFQNQNKIETQVQEKNRTNFADVQNPAKNPPIERIVLSPQEALQNAKTIAIRKSSLYPSRQELEKDLLKRKDWQKYNFNIVRLKEDADLYIEIGHVPFTIVSCRYVFRIYDRQSGTVLAAGETTSWGNLSENLAREIIQKLNSISTN